MLLGLKIYWQRGKEKRFKKREFIVLGGWRSSVGFCLYFSDKKTIKSVVGGCLAH